jgi:hypothetical protein
MIVTRSISPKLRNVPEKIADKSKHTFYVSAPFNENRPVYEIMLTIYGATRHATGEDIIRRMLFAYWVTKATDTHAEYVILIAVALQPLLRKLVSLLRL